MQLARLFEAFRIFLFIACADVQCSQQGNPSAHAGCPNFLTFACILHGIAKKGKVESQLATLHLS